MENIDKVPDFVRSTVYEEQSETKRSCIQTDFHQRKPTF